MADGNRQQGFGFHATGASKLRQGEIVVDLFAGGGGASEALRQALGRDPDICINHDAWAIGMHAANHPLARHLCEDVRLIDLLGRRPSERTVKNIAFIGDDSLAQISEERRPGISAMARKIAAEHPKWSVARVMHEAKIRYTTKRSMRPNP